MSIPSAEAMMRDIEEIVALGVRRPGHPGDQAAEDWAVAAFLEAGLEDVAKEPFELPMWESDGASVEVWSVADPGRRTRFEGLALPYTLSTGGLERDVVRFDEADPAAARDRIVVEPLTLTSLPQAFLRDAATSWFDPDGDFDSLAQVLPFGSRLNRVVDPAIEAGAAGYIGLTTGFPWETCDYYVPYDAEARAVAGLWLSRSDGSRLEALLDDGPLRARITVDGRRTPTQSSNIVGRLRGPGDEAVVVGSHHDAPWASAVEDASGMALVLAQARYWASVPEVERPHNMVFLLTAGHMCGGAGTRAFVEQHRDWIDDVVLEVHLEHVAAEVTGDGTSLTLTGEPEPRWWFTSADPKLEASVAAAIEAEDVRRSFVLPCEIFGDAPPTDGYMFHLAGVPVVDLLAAPMYLFDPADTLDKVHGPSLEPLSRAVIRIISSTRGWRAAEVRAAIKAAVNA